jgi:hypothetical protein
MASRRLPGGLPGDQGQRFGLHLHALWAGQLIQELDNGFDRDAPELVPLAARQHRRRDLVHFGRRQHEDGMCGRLLQRLEQGIEGGRGKHMHFINNIDFIAAQVRGEVDLIAQAAHILHAGIGSCIDLDQVQEAALVERQAVLALVAGRLARSSARQLTALAKQASGGGLAGAARPGEQVGVGNAPCSQRIAQRLHDVFLSDDLVPLLGSPFTVEGL